MTRLLSSFTTLGLGGPAKRIVEVRDEESLVTTIKEADFRQEQILVIGGGSNLVVSDAGFDGTVVCVRSQGIKYLDRGGQVVVEVQAGEIWDDLVERFTEDGCAGVEFLSGIPGSVGATPIQNVGAYDQEIKHCIVHVRVYDRDSGHICELGPQKCRFTYRSSLFKQQRNRWVILSVTLALTRQPVSFPVTHRDVYTFLGVTSKACVPLRLARSAVLAVRRSKGMVIDESDPDTRSVGSFFLNPSLSEEQADALEERIRFMSILRPDSPVTRRDAGGIQAKAAWLIEEAGFGPGYGNPEGIALSSKHVLALTNRGRGTTDELMALAVKIMIEVRARFGIELRPEPDLVGIDWPSITIPVS